MLGAKIMTLSSGSSLSTHNRDTVFRVLGPQRTFLGTVGNQGGFHKEGTFGLKFYFGWPLF